MNRRIKLIFALNQIKNVSKLVTENEYEKYIISHLVPIQVELKRQLSLL